MNNGANPAIGSTSPGNYNNTLALVTGGSIDDNNGAGKIVVPDLALAAGGTVTLTNSANGVSTLAGSASGGTFDFTNGSNLTIGSVAGTSGISGTSGAVVALTVATAGDTLTVNQAIINATEIDLTADSMSINAALNASSTGLVVLTPFTTSLTISLGTVTANELSLTNAELQEVTAELLEIGANGTYTGTIANTGAISQNNNVTVLILNTTGAVTNGGGSIDVTSLGIAAGTGIGTAGTALATAVTNLDFTNSTSGVVNITNTGALTVATSNGVTPSNSGGATTLTVLQSPLTIGSNLTSAGTVTLVSTENVNETGNPPESTIDINSGITVTSTNGNVVLTAADGFVFASGDFRHGPQRYGHRDRRRGRGRQRQRRRLHGRRHRRQRYRQDHQ